jgi:YidC/Oxa1 family membrane protein insertase
MIELAAVLHTASTTAATVAKSSGGGSILDPIAKPIAWVLAGIYSVIPNYGVAIIGLSLLWMVLIAPLTLKSTRSMLAMQKLQPQLKKLQEQHRSDKQAFAQAQMELFREHQVSPFGSCLPMLLPLPVFFALFRVIDGLSHTSTINGVVHPTPKYLDLHTQMYKSIVAAHGHLQAFGMDLAKNAFSPHNGILAAAPFWIALLVMAATSYFQSAMMMNRNPSAMQNNPQMKMMKYLPLIFVVFCSRFPAGVIVYYAMSNICRIVQQDAMYRYDPRVKALVSQEVSEVEEMTAEIDERDRDRINRPGYTPPRGPKPPAPAPASGRGRTEGAPPAGGRSRFRDLLAAAAEQQQTQQKAKAAGNGSSAPPAKTPQGNGNGNGNGARPANGKATGSTGSSKGRPAPARTNRKRRGR